MRRSSSMVRPGIAQKGAERAFGHFGVIGHDQPAMRGSLWRRMMWLPRCRSTA
jgi:hypothetical protein